MEDRKELIKRKVEAVRELKSRYYIGTYDAKKYLDSYDLVYTEPRKWADKVNSSLPKDARYKATPERIVGLSYPIDELIWDKTLNEMGVDDLEGSDDRVRTYFQQGNWHPIVFAGLFDIAFTGFRDFDIKKEKKEESERWFSNFFVKTFIEMNKSSDTNDFDLVNTGLSYLCNDLKNYTYRPHEEFDYVVKHLKRELAISYSDVRFDTNMLREKEKEALKINADTHIDWVQVLDKIEKDKVDNRMEYRRQVALLFAEQMNGKSGNDTVELAKIHAKILGPFAHESTFSRVIPILVSEKRFLDRILSS